VSRIVRFSYDRKHLPARIEADSGMLEGCFSEARKRMQKGDMVNHNGYSPEYIDFTKVRDLGWDDFSKYIDELKNDMLLTKWSYDQLDPSCHQIFDIKQFKDAPWLEVLIDTYDDGRLKRKFFGYSDIMQLSTIMLTSEVFTYQHFANCYDYVFVDEYQDVNRAQNTMLMKLDDQSSNMMVIGDDDQTIYEWRGARPTFIRDKLDDKQWQTFFLDRNFRCSPGSILLAREVIEQNTNRAAKKMMPAKGFTGQLCVERFESIGKQAQWIVDLIEESYQSSSSRTEERHYDNAVVLIRQYAETPIIEEELISKGIPYTIPGSKPFYYRPEFRLIESYLRLAEIEIKRSNGFSLTNTDSEEFSNHFLRVYIRPATFLRKTTAIHLLRQLYTAQGEVKPIHTHLREIHGDMLRDNGRSSKGLLALADYFEKCLQYGDDISARQAIETLSEQIEIKRWFIESSVNEQAGEARAAIVDGLLDYVRNDKLQQFLRAIAARRELDAAEEATDARSRVKILTIFKAKGLEFPRVIIPNLNATASQQSSSGMENDLDSLSEEERRIIYVALTRPIDDLFISFTGDHASQSLQKANYGQLLKFLPDAKALYEGSLDRVSDQSPAFFVARLSARFVKFQLGPLCAKSWADALTAEDQENLEGKISELFRIFRQEFTVLSVDDKKKVDICETEWSNIGNMAREIRRLAFNEATVCSGDSNSIQDDLPTRLEENYIKAPSAGDAYIFDLELD
jgi:DNA helicase II / ATP-dependent DNA helicase PcrA